jgi:hypothetical protein
MRLFGLDDKSQNAKQPISLVLYLFPLLRKSSQRPSAIGWSVT